MGLCVRCGMKFMPVDFENGMVAEEYYEAHDGKICPECHNDEERSLNPEDTPSVEKFLPGRGEGNFARKALPWKKQRRVKPEHKRFS